MMGVMYINLSLDNEELVQFSRDNIGFPIDISPQGWVVTMQQADACLL
jgi:hypothetical protein